MIKVLNVGSLYTSLYETVKMCKENIDKEIEIIVPDKLSLFMEKFLFDKLNIESSFNIKVSTLNRFAKKNINISSEQQITTNGSILLVYKILNELREQLSSLKSIKYSFSYAENIFATISQLKASRILPEEMKSFVCSDERLTGKIQDLALIYEKYEIMKTGLLDASDVFLMSVFSVAEGRKNSNLLFVGFDDFTAIQYAIIEQLAICANVNVFNYYSNESNARIYNPEVYSQLRNIAYINQLKFEVKNCNASISKTKQFLQNNLFSLKKDSFVLEDESIKIFESNSISNEIEFVARDIRNKILEGSKFSNFGVAVFGVENKLNKIKEIFEKYEINYYIDNDLTLNNSICYKFLTSIFKFNENPSNIVYLIDIINSPFFNLENEEKSKLIEKLLLLKSVGFDLDKYDFGDELAETKNVLAEFLRDFKIEKDYSVSNVFEIINLACKKYNFENILMLLAEECDNLQNKILLLKSIELVEGVFADIIKFYEFANFETISDIFTRIASVVKVNNLPLSIDCVKVSDAENTMEIFKHLYIVNCTSETAPLVKSDCGIILDGEIEKLNFAHKLSPTIAHVNKLSKLRVFNTSLLFENSLTITYSKNASELVKELLQKIKVNIDGVNENLIPFYNLDLGKYIALSEWDCIEYLCKNDNKNKKLFEKLIKNKEINNISLENLNIFKNLKTISASQLENYFKCPFYSFLTNTIKIKPKMENDILALDIGNILHEILREYYSRDKNVVDVHKFVQEQVSKYVLKDERLKINEKSPVLKNLIEEAVRVIDGVNYIDDNSLFKTNKKLLEVEFSANNALRLRNIDLIGKIDRIDLCGDMARIIDYKSGRADANLKELYYGNKLQLFLYSCACEMWLKKNVVGGFYLPLHNKYTKEQGNTYSLKGFFVNDEQVISAFDKRLQPGEKSDIVNVKMNKENKASRTLGYKELSSVEMSWLKDYSKQVTEQAVDEIKQGYIKPSPSDVSKLCEHCPYSHVCLRRCSNIQYRSTDKILPESFKRGEYERV